MPCLRSRRFFSSGARGGLASTNIANVAHFMGALIVNPKVWDDWKGKLPVIVNGFS